ncbi:MAG: cob(I)yrinic acid a,c-diamide adenosyltransferase [Nitrospirae bacterium RBG_13_39_12]|nr:MAG: cob(I)yrinic acid a,c-diamide adenosyltransferase [Nitrospirae bacterium RBG_13_39_12]
MKKPKLKILEPEKKVGLVIVMTGEGKGKTTSALGIALRAAGYGLRVCIIEFIKGDMYSGELDGIKKLFPYAEIHLMGKGFCGVKGDKYSYQDHRAKAQEALRLAKKKISSRKIDILVLDEINYAVKLKLVDLPQVLELIENKPLRMHLVLTGRGAHREVIKRAHTVTEMKEIKHAFKSRIEPQKGIDY